MSDKSAIQWTDATWNPVRGCSVVSPGCVNCYAMRQAYRYAGEYGAFKGLAKQTSAGPQWTGVVRFVPAKLSEPLKWRKPRRIFVNSMSDLFHESLSFEDIARVFGVMACAPQHTFQILTKRPERFAAWEAWIANQAQELIGGVGMEPDNGADARASACVVMAGEKRTRENFDAPEHGVLSLDHWRVGMRATWPLPSVWLGVSCEDQRRADERIQLLLDTPAAVRFVSAEPLIGPVDLSPWIGGVPIGGTGSERAWVNDGAGLDWVIVGGESGPKSRPCDVAWIRSIVGQCKAAGVAVFCKQLGANVACVEADAFASARDTNDGWRANLNDRKGGEMSEWPSDLRVREFPVTDRRKLGGR